MLSILIALFLIFYLTLAKIRLDWAVMLLIAALPSYLIRFQVLGVPFTLLEAMILIAFAVLVVTNLRELIANIRKSKLRNYFKRKDRYPFDVEIILLLLISYGAMAISGFSDSALGIWKAYFFEPALVFILALNILRDRRSPLRETAAEQKNDGKDDGDDGSIVPLGLWSRIANRIANYYQPFTQWLHRAPAAAMEPSMPFMIEKILWPLAVSAFFVSVLAIYQKFTGAWIPNELWAAEETRRVTSFFGYPNAVGLYLGPIVMVMIGWLFFAIAGSGAERRSNHEIIAMFTGLLRRFLPASRHGAPRNGRLKLFFIGLTIILSLLSIYFAKSEGALAGVLAGLAMFGMLAGRKIRLAALLLIFAVGAGIMIYQPASPRLQRCEPAWNYAVKKITLTDLSGEIRKQQWKETWKMMAISPARFIFGAGLANYQNAIQPYHQEGIFFNKGNDPDFRRKIVIFNDQYRKEHWQPVEIYLYPHNIFLNFWAELGLAGMLLFVWIIGKYVYMGIRNLKFEIRNPDLKNKYLTLGLVCAITVIVVHGLVDVPYFKNDLAVIFWLLVAMVGIMDLSPPMDIGRIPPADIIIKRREKLKIVK